jgi:hypothetical protein
VATPAGYSGTPLYRKLGIKSGMRLTVLGAPEDYWDLMPDLPEVQLTDPTDRQLDLVHAFVTTRAQLRDAVRRYKNQIVPNGTIWISWPKKSSGVTTDITEDVVREEALPLGLVDVKVCAVDHVWSGLKLVLRKENRA